MSSHVSRPQFGSIAAALTLLSFALSLPSGAQTCTGLPAIPDGTITVTQDRDRMMCQQGLSFPILPTRQGTAWPWNDPTAPTNAWPTNLANPEGNWTDKQGHVVVRTAWGNWHTYDSDPIYEPSPLLHYPDIPDSQNGGAMSGVGDYGPFSNPRYRDLDILKMKNGTAVTTPENWWTSRRPEVFTLVQQELYGTPIPVFPVAWTVTLGATGTQVGTDGRSYPYQEKTIRGVVDTSSFPGLRNPPIVSATCRFPAPAGIKRPVVITYSEGTGIFQYTAPYGIGTCSYNPVMVQPDSGGANLSSYLIGLMNAGNWRRPSDPGSLVAWAWGVSRLIDEFTNDPDFDPDKVGVEGHSRYGKATLVTGAYDERVTVTWPSDSGAMGAALIRRTYGEGLEFVSSSTSEYHWLNGYSMNYGGRLNSATLFPRRVELLDVDSHSTTSLVAPRAIFVTNGTDTPPGVGDAWADPRGCFLSGLLASPVWNLLGWKGQIIPAGTVFTSPGQPGTALTAGPAESVSGTPPFDVAFIDGTVGWRRQSQGHTPTPNWPSFMLFASRYLNDVRPIVPGQSFNLGGGLVNYVGKLQGTSGSAGPLQSWQIKGGNGVGVFKVDAATGDITIPDPSLLDTTRTTPYSLIVIAGDGQLVSHDATVTIMPVPIIAGNNQLLATAVLTKLSSGGYQALVTITNQGVGTAQNVQLSSATLGGSSSTTQLPQSLVNIAPGSFATVALVFPQSAGNSGAAALERFAGTYSGGVFAGSIRTTLP